MTDLKEVKKTYRDPDGAVITQPKNFLTNPMKKGAPNCTPNTILGEQLPHMTDPYDQKREIAKKERIAHEAKL